MNKLIAVAVASLFAISANVFAADKTAAPAKTDAKTEVKAEAKAPAKDAKTEKAPAKADTTKK